MSDIKTIYPELHPQLAKLSWEQVEELQRVYLANELKVPQILEQFGLQDVPKGALKYRISVIIDKEVACPACNTYAYRKLKSRDGRLSMPYCPSCGKQLMYPYTPKNKQEDSIRRPYPQSFQEEILSNFNLPKVYGHITEEAFSSLTYELRIFLGAMVKSAASEDLTTVDLIEVLYRKACPLKNWYDELVSGLGIHGLIPSAGLLQISFKFDSDLAHYLFNPTDRLRGSEEEILGFWKKLAYYECLDYYTYRMREVNFDVRIGEKTELVFKRLIEDYSTGQIWSIIFKEVQNSCEFFTRGDATRLHAGNTVIGNLERRADRYRLAGYTIYPYNRSYNYAIQSDISSYFFDTVLGIGDAGFKERPSLERIVSLEES